jgi:integrase/recombinase XerC
LAPRVSDALRRHGMPDRGWVFRRLDGGSGPNLPGTISALSAEHLRSLGIPATLHQLRHRFATQLYQRSRDIRLLQDILGHSSPATSALYAAWAPAAAEHVMSLGRRRAS